MNIFIEIGLIVLVATAICSVMKFLKQPLIIGYILSGIIIGPFFLNLAQSTDYIELFSKIGIAILLFIVGLNLKPDIVREVGKESFLIGLGQIIIVSSLGFFVMRLFGFGITSSLYGAIALTLSSTIIILKLLSDKGDLNKLYGKIAIGFLLVQDIFATLILLTVSIIGSSSSLVGSAVSGAIILSIMKGVLLFVALYLISKYILPKLLSFMASSQELLFLFSIAWGLGLASLFYVFGFSIEIGALVAGVILSASPFSIEISSRMKPLRDFFILLFFVLLGSKVILFNISGMILPALILSLFVLVINPLIVTIIMKLLGHKSRTSFFVGITASQISEFSLILLALGFSLGQINNDLISLITLTWIITIIGSTYFISNTERLYLLISPILHFIKAHKLRDEKNEKVDEGSMVIFGYDRVGYDFVNIAEKMKMNYFVVDFNPKLITKFKKNNINFRFGDAEDVDFLEEIDVIKAKLVVSTIPDFKTNLNLVSFYRQHNKNGVIIVISHNIKNTEEFYKQGASFVVMPHYLGAMNAAKMIESHVLQEDFFEKEKKEHLEYLEKRRKVTEE
jgi:Kef-type K+ transport system membrane component KefB